jgi:tetratricopeptide (TPR) repeat protein
MRSLAEVEQAVQKSIQAKKRLDPKDPIIDQARKDANAAIAAGALADGNFAAGRVAEELGDKATAEKHYREALKAHPADDRAGSRYRVALGRILLQFTPPKLGPEAGEGNGKKVGMKAPKLDLERQLRLAIEKKDTTALFVLLTVAAVQPEDDLDNDPALDEAIRLGEAAIRAGNPEGYLVKGLALARKGMWTEALQSYTEGLRRIIKPDQGAGLYYIIDHHPAFQLPDALRNPDLAVAEKHYANGLRDYFLGRYPQAEKELLEAYRNNGQDARILYYLGLARLGQQGKRDQAIVNFQMGALLERQQKPGSAAVGAALERVQGAPRRSLETYRP